MGSSGYIYIGNWPAGPLCRPQNESAVEDARNGKGREGKTFISLSIMPNDEENHSNQSGSKRHYSGVNFLRIPIRFPGTEGFACQITTSPYPTF